MVKTSLTTKDILKKQFKHTFKGYSIQEVDEFLDIIIRDYDTFQKQITFLQAENERLINKVDELSRQAKLSKATRTNTVPTTGVTNFDILKRLSNLEKHVFDSKLAQENHDEIQSTLEDDHDDLDKTRIITPI